ncbi:MAG: homoserine kinase, partial [Trebonia sp.]
MRVLVPATSANLGPGFDALGLALSLHDEVEARVTGTGLDIEVSGEGAARVADAGEKHLIVRAMRVAFDDLGLPQPSGLALRCVNRIPHGRGLGSSAAAIVAGLVAARGLAGGPVGAEDVLPLANVLEGHPDNVAPCLYGGLTIAWVADRQPQPSDTYPVPQAPSRGLAPGEGAMGEGLPYTWESHQGGKRTGTGTTEDIPGAAGAVPGLVPGEGAMA